MSSPIDKNGMASRGIGAAARVPSLARARKGSSTSLNSLPARMQQPSAIKSPSAEVQLDLSSASAQDHPSSLAASRNKSKTLSPSASSSKSAARTSVLESSQVWRSSAAKRAEKAWAIQSEKALASDQKFKKYTALIDKTLATFDSVSEWADFISFLSRLLKSFQAYPHFNVIPRKLIVSKRLAQCLNPALPSGVHQRALDVYSHILTVIGPDGLRRDLQIWSSGLLPFFQYASTSVKPTLLGIYEKYFLPLHEDLRPVMRALLLALLPGLEEETGEFFDRTLKLLDSISRSVSQPFFLQCLWLVLITTPPTRLAALNYLGRRMPNLNEEVDPSRLIGKDVGLMVRGIAHSLEDETLLVRRNALELLVTHLRMDRPTFQRYVKTHDKVLLVRAATSVVLHRDLSLNRRLYTWLLGSDESVEAQAVYLQTNGLELLRRALKEGFDVDADTAKAMDAAERQRPYKIFVSLLDKWEIGQPLTRVLALDAFRALSRQMEGHQPDDITTTAKMLFEVVDPFLLYGQFLFAIQREFQGTTGIAGDTQEEGVDEPGPVSALELLCFVLKAFHVHGEESKQIHLPMLFGSLLELIKSKLEKGIEDGKHSTDPQILDALELLKLIIVLVPPRVFVRVETDDEASDSTLSESFLSRANMFYQSGETHAEEAARHFKGFQDTASTNGLLDLAAWTSSACTRLSSPESSSPHEPFVRMLDVFADLLRLVDASEAPEESTVIRGNLKRTVAKLPWDMNAWAQTLLPQLEAATSFAQVERIVEMLISCALFRPASSSLDLDQGHYLEVIATKLLSYMELSMSPYHIRAVELLWATHKITQPRHLEMVLCQLLSKDTSSRRTRAMQAFGSLWRLSDDRPCDELRGPLLLVLDKLRSSELEDQQLAKAWLRANLRSYAKVVDPLFLILLGGQARLETKKLDIEGLQIEIFEHTMPTDLHQCNYALQTLVSLSKFSGQGFARAMRANPVSASVDRMFKEQARPENTSTQPTYLDALLDYCTQALRSYPMTGLQTTAGKTNALLQSSSVELIQNLVQRGNLDKSRLRDLETALIEAILIATQTASIERQNKVLHALHSIILARTPGPIRPTNGERQFSLSSGTMEVREDGPTAEPRSAPSRGHPALAPHPLLLTMTRRGLSAPSNRPILQHWSDFVLMTMPYFRSSVNSLLLPVNDCICSLLKSGIADLERAYKPGSSRLTFGADLAVQSADDDCLTSESDITLLINMSERILLQALGEVASQRNPSRDPSSSYNEFSEKSPNPNQESASGLLGYVSNVFSADQSTAAAGKAGSIVDNRLTSLQTTVHTLHAIWTAAYRTLSPADAKSLALESLAAKVRLRCRQAFEKIYRSHSAQVVEALLDCWQRSRCSKEGDRDASVRAVFDILDLVAPSAQIVVTFLCDVLSTRTFASGERSRKPSGSSTTTDAALFAFLDAYLARMDSQAAPQVWPVMIMLVKDFAASSTSRKLHIFPVLKVFTSIGEKLCQTTALEDRRIRRDLQDNYVKLVDSCILISGRSFDQSTWIRRSGKDNLEDLEVESSGAAETDEKAAIPGVETPGKSLIDAIKEFLAARAFAALRKFQVDGDKINSIAANTIYYIVTPGFRNKSKTLDIDPDILAIIAEMVKLPGTLKAWRTTVGDLFQDNRFFTMTPEVAQRWRPIILALMTNDKERFIELICKITSAASANIFTNRELEMLTRALNLRRLSFVIYSGDRDTFLPQLPSIQEKVVDLLRSNVSELVHAEVYLCMRVLLCRFSARHLASFWPVIIAELMRLFEGLIDDLPADESDQLQLVLSASKFLDLLLVLQTEDFQIHQWMFVTDTTDVVYAPDDWVAESIIDRLATTISDRRSTLTPSEMDPFSLQDTPVRRAMRKPTLTLRDCKRIDQLLPFFQRISLDAYEATYQVGVRLIDHKAVETGLVSDMFEGV